MCLTPQEGEPRPRDGSDFPRVGSEFEVMCSQSWTEPRRESGLQLRVPSARVLVRFLSFESRLPHPSSPSAPSGAFLPNLLPQHSLRLLFTEVKWKLREEVSSMGNEPATCHGPGRGAVSDSQRKGKLFLCSLLVSASLSGRLIKN